MDTKGMGIGVKVYKEDHWSGWTIKTISSETPKFWVCKYKNSVGTDDSIMIDKESGKERGSGGGLYGSSYWFVLTEEKKEQFMWLNFKAKTSKFKIDITKLNKETEGEIKAFMKKYGETE